MIAGSLTIILLADTFANKHRQELAEVTPLRKNGAQFGAQPNRKYLQVIEPTKYVCRFSILKPGFDSR